MKIKINGAFFEYFNGIKIDTALDTVASTFSFDANFDPTNKDHVALFRPLAYHKVEFLHDNGKPIATGTLLHHSFGSAAVPSLVTVTGYSLPGVLEDCQVPYDLYPLESNNRSLKEIATRLLNYFGLKLIVYANVEKECNQKIAKSVAEPEESIKEYLAKIAAQKNVVVSHDVYGNLIFFRPEAAGPAKYFYTGENTTDMQLEVNGQGIHSKITTLRQPTKNKAAAVGLFDDTPAPSTENTSLTPVDTVVNPMITVVRPKVDKLSSGDITDTRKGAYNSMAEELKSITLSFNVNRWDPISIGDIIEVQNPELYLFSKVRWMVSSTGIEENTNDTKMSVNCVLPETYSGTKPVNIFI